LRAWAESLIIDRARQIHALSEWLLARDVRVPRVRAFGTIREGRKPFYAVERARGRSLYDLVIREGRAIPAALCRKVVDAVAGLHRLGYWLGDAHLSHVFVHEGEVSAFIDIDGMRRSGPPHLGNLARDLAGLNHPGLSLGRGDKESLLRHYAGRMHLKDARAFQRMVEHHSARRWKSWRPDPGAGTPAP
jgi:tRNA A-37 threonylcarbamoyl transferase component Bud32